MQKLVILGSGGNCFDIVDVVRDLNSAKERYQLVGFLDDNKEKLGQEYQGVAVIGGLHKVSELCDCTFVNGIGSTSNFRKKKEILNSLSIPPERYASIVHPSAWISPSASIGRGVVLFQNCVVTSNAKVGDHVIVLPNCVISHDDSIGDYCCIAGGVNVSGAVTIGESCYIGSNSSIREKVTIGPRSLIGMGSCVLNDCAPDSVIVGNPGRALRRE